MAVARLYEVGMRTAQERLGELKEEVEEDSATRNSPAVFHSAATGFSYATILHAGTAKASVVEIHQFSYSKQQLIPNTESSSLSTNQLAGFNPVVARLTRATQGLSNCTTQL